MAFSVSVVQSNSVAKFAKSFGVRRDKNSLGDFRYGHIRRVPAYAVAGSMLLLLDEMATLANEVEVMSDLAMEALLAKTATFCFQPDATVVPASYPASGYASVPIHFQLSR